MEMSGLMNNITGYRFQEKAKIMYINRYNSKLMQKNLDCFTLAMFRFMFNLIKFLLEGCVSDFRDYYFRPKMQTVSSNPPPSPSFSYNHTKLQSTPVSWVIMFVSISQNI